MLARVAHHVRHLLLAIQTVQRYLSPGTTSRELALLPSVLDSLPDYIWICDPALRKTVYISLGCERLLGVPRDELLGDCRKLLKLVHQVDRRRVIKARLNAAAKGYDETYRVVRPDGTVRWVQDRSFPVANPSGGISSVGGIAVDVTERKEGEQHLVELAYFDALTKLPNRTLFYDRLAQSAAHARRNGWTLAVLFVDIDGFKRVNDASGHAAGDELLKQIAQRLKACARSDDTVGRLSGDEFAVVLSKVTGRDDAELVAKKILEILRTPFLLEKKPVCLSASIGIALYPIDSIDYSELVRKADVAMYHAKAAGRDNCKFFCDAPMTEIASETLHLLTPRP